MWIETEDGDMINFDHVSAVISDKNEFASMYTIRAAMDNGIDFILEKYASPEELETAMKKIRRLFNAHSIENVPQTYHYY